MFLGSNETKVRVVVGVSWVWGFLVWWVFFVIGLIKLQKTKQKTKQNKTKQK